MQFLTPKTAPDSITIWLFRESLMRAGAIDNLFARFAKHLSRSGYLAKGSQIVDTKIVHAPRQDEKKAIKASEDPHGEEGRARQTRAEGLRCALDIEASDRNADISCDCDQQHDVAIPMLGYKSHARIDRAHGFTPDGR